MVLGLGSLNSLSVIIGIVAILYLYLWLHDQEKAMVVTKGIGTAILGIVKLTYRVCEGIFSGLYRLIFK